jgi:beta-N-acetylhexosaminidase
VVSDFLAQRPDIVRNRRVVVFAFDAPYYLDTTDLSKLTAFYALYSRTPDFVTVAARLLFRDFTPNGAPPVSITANGYDLISVTRPDPDNLIELFWQKATPSDEPVTTLQLGDAITLTTGTLLDHNGHQVPDQTPVLFRVFYAEEGLPDLFTVPTMDGVASMVLQLERVGRLDITASSEPALLSGLLSIPVQEDPFSVTEVVPTPMPTNTAVPTATDVPPTATLMPTPTPTEVIVPEEDDRLVDLRGFFVMCLGLAAALVGGYRLGNNHEAQTRQGVRVALAGAIGLLLAYNYIALGLPGSAVAYGALGALAAPFWAIVGGAVGVAAGWYWFVGRKSL